MCCVQRFYTEHDVISDSKARLITLPRQRIAGWLRKNSRQLSTYSERGLGAKNGGSSWFACDHDRLEKTRFSESRYPLYTAVHAVQYTREFARRAHATKMDPLPHGKLYHSFVVHSSADTDYVKRKLIPQLEDDRGLKLCFSWRDYEAKGDKDAALSNLNRCLAESCVVALLVTNNYAASASSQDATRIALELMGREAIIRIVLEKGVNTPNLSGQGLVKIELFNPEVKANFFENLSKLISRSTNAGCEWG